MSRDYNICGECSNFIIKNEELGRSKTGVCKFRLGLVFAPLKYETTRACKSKFNKKEMIQYDGDE